MILQDKRNRIRELFIAKMRGIGKEALLEIENIEQAFLAHSEIWGGIEEFRRVVRAYKVELDKICRELDKEREITTF